uniref:Uncharacterized protein n=1 Tax=Panagrolaimus sp. PS1159 TaxID=55785 RepID=A0AC35FHL0_9BILA
MASDKNSYYIIFKALIKFIWHINMAINVGIYPNYGDISYSNESEKELVDCINFNFKKIIRVNSEEIEKVDLMFEEITSEINGKELGSACICLDEYYYNEIRQKFIESGLKHGFKHVEIINYETAFYLNAMCQINHKPKNGDIIWIKDGYKYNVWTIKNQKALFIGYWESGTFYLNDFQKIVEKSQLNKGPNVLLYNSKINEATCKKFGCQLFCYENDKFCFSKASLVKIAKKVTDYEFAYLETESFLSHTVILKIGEKEIKTFQVVALVKN